ncbi:MAG TPA: low molecular weight protein-tyrosine-phosphatase [Cellulomonas sp.]
MTVCTGNICRSPMAEVVLRDRLEQAGLGDRVLVDSTGVSDEEHGNPIDPRARAALAARGYKVPRRTARQARVTDLRDNDLVLAMTASHARSLRRLGGPELADRVVMYRTFDPAAPVLPVGGSEHLLDVDDPWYGGPEDFEHCLDEIEAAADGVVVLVRGLLGA